MVYNREMVIWSAGLFEGEGSISVVEQPYGLYPRIKVKMCDRDSVQRFADTFGLSVKDVKKDRSWKEHYKDAYYTDATGTRAYSILVAMYPWLGERRQRRTEEVIRMWCS